MAFGVGRKFISVRYLRSAGTERRHDRRQATSAGEAEVGLARMTIAEMLIELKSPEAESGDVRYLMMRNLSGGQYETFLPCNERQPARDRLRLSYYYVQDLTLREVGALMGESESTVSRRLADVRLRIRGEVERTLRDDHRLNNDQVTRCLDYAAEDWAFNLEEALAQGK